MRVSGFGMTPSRSACVGPSGLLRGFGFLQAVQKICCALRVRCGAEYRALVVFQHLDPRRNIGGVILANLRRQVEVRRKEGGAKLREFLHSVAFIAPALPPEIPVETRRVASPMGLMPISA